LNARDQFEDLSIDEGHYEIRMKEIGWDVLDWSELAQDRGKWQVLVYKAMNLWVIQNMRNSWLTGKLLAFRKLACCYELVVWSVGQSFCQSVGW
jgi:hypothetical protein